MSTDIITLGEAKAGLGQENLNNENDNDLQTYISAISQRLDKECGPIVQRTITDEYYDGGNQHIWLKNAPIISVTSLVEYQGTTAVTLTRQQGGTLPNDGYTLDTEIGKISRTASGWKSKFYCQQQNIKITYEAGRYTSTSTVEELFKLAAQAFLSHVWQMNLGIGSETFPGYEPGQYIASYSLPNRVKDLLGNDNLKNKVAVA